MPSHNPTNNPYTKAAGAYGDHALKHTPDQRELEGRVLLKAARMIQEVQSNWDSNNREALEKVLQHNRQIWLMFYDTALENPEGKRPGDLRSNIVNLANFIFKREIEIMADPKKEKLDVLISINKEIAAGLMSKPGSANAGPADKK